ncbi:hypothetical protein GOBAR_DD34950 [Gossypium barbadense]|nr:hypothetical protein GOBAR_DD34950 [Gossypium barbadense]
MAGALAMQSKAGDRVGLELYGDQATPNNKYCRVETYNWCTQCLLPKPAFKIQEHIATSSLHIEAFLKVVNNSGVWPIGQGCSLHTQWDGIAGIT